MVMRVPPRYSDFYPRPPRGGRRLRVMSSRGTWLFLSTPSARRATNLSTTYEFTKSDFYPRPPRGGRLMVMRVPPKYSDFYPRPPRGGRQMPSKMFSFSFSFLSTPSARRATNFYNYWK